MAADEVWSKLRYFKKMGTSDNWGDPNAISGDLLLRLDDFRHFIGVPVHVTHGVAASGHADHSYHYLEFGACAVDIVIPDWRGGAIDLILAAERFNFTGLGLYLHWRWRDREVLGLHLDWRALGTEPDGTVNFKESRWLGVKIKGVQKYVPLTYANLKKYGGERL